MGYLVCSTRYHGGCTSLGVYTTSPPPGTPSHQPAILRCTHHPLRDSLAALTRAVVERTVGDELLTVHHWFSFLLSRFTVGQLLLFLLITTVIQEGGGHVAQTGPHSSSTRFTVRQPFVRR